MPTDAAEFVRAHTRLRRVPYVPELRLHLAEEPIGVWEDTERDTGVEQPPPFWAFAWAGGQALARHVLDHPGLVSGLRVLDVASGCGVAAVAAARSGAAVVEAVDVDPAAVAALRRNADANNVTVLARTADVGIEPPGAAQVVLAGDVFYSPRSAERMTSYLRSAHRAGARVLVGDPARGFLPVRLFERVAEYAVPVPVALEGTAVLRTGVYEIRATAGR